MKPAHQLDAFVQAGLGAGHSPDELRVALLAEGWSQNEVAIALAGWSDRGLGVAVPRPQAKGARQDAVLYALMLVALLIVTFNLGDLGFELIETWLPDPLHDPYSYSGTAGMRWSIALLIVALPVFLWLDRRAARVVASDPGERRSPLRHQFGAFTLFLSSLALLGSAVAVVYAGLAGVVTAQFLAKVALVAVIAGLVIAWFRDFLSDGVVPRLLPGLLVPFTVVMIGLGLWQSGGPEQARIEQRDAQRMEDLQALASFLTCDSARRDGADYDCGTRPNDVDRFTQAPMTVTETEVCAEFEQPDRVAQRFPNQMENGCIRLD